MRPKHHESPSRLSESWECGHLLVSCHSRENLRDWIWYVETEEYALVKGTATSRDEAATLALKAAVTACEDMASAFKNALEGKVEDHGGS